MEHTEILEGLRRQIDEKILPLVTSDYVLWGLPYYFNPGDTLIWEGTLQCLRASGHKCLGTCGWDEYRYRELKKDTVILITGGGYMGDLWRQAWQGVMDTIVRYPDNPVVVMPQSIHYEDEKLAEADAKALAGLPKLTICVRDKQSLDYALARFRANKVMLVPDMAFHISLSKLERFRKPSNGKRLYLKRRDKEMPAGTDLEEKDFEVRDWPLMSERLTPAMRLITCVGNKLKWHPWIPGAMRTREKWLYFFNRNQIVREAVQFLSPYDEIYTTRLHVMILAFLLGKETVIVDNSYGKVSGCYETWLKQSDKIKLYGK